MQTSGILVDIREFIVTNFLFGRDDELNEEESLLQQGIIDSTGVLELVSFLEEHFDMEIDDDEIVPANLDSIRDLVNYVSGKVGNKPEQECHVSTRVS